MSYNPYSANEVSPSNGPHFEEQARSKLKAPGIAMIVIGALGLMLMGAYFLLTLFALISGATPMEPPPEMTLEAERTGFFVGVYGMIATIGLNALLQTLVILGGIAMVRAKGRGLAVTGSIISVIPCLGSSLCFLGIPFGIWALVVLADTNVKQLFK